MTGKTSACVVCGMRGPWVDFTEVVVNFPAGSKPTQKRLLLCPTDGALLTATLDHWVAQKLTKAGQKLAAVES